MLKKSMRVESLQNRMETDRFAVSYRIVIGRQVMQGLHTVTGNATNTLNRRPFFVFWFMAQVKSYV